MSTLTGEPPTPGGEQLCALLGQSTPFDQTKLTSLYSNRQTYLDTFDDALDRAVTW